MQNTVTVTVPFWLNLRLAWSQKSTKSHNLIMNSFQEKLQTNEQMNKDRARVPHSDHPYKKI